MAALDIAATINNALNEVVEAIPILSTAYNLYKIIWMRTNPAATEDDYRAHLQTSSQTNIDTTAVLLKADGFVENPPGTWTKPPA